ncbi:MAG TPA: hypothetical protein VMW38_15785 [Terriglobia bacterium]|nr:hypothetical protein [Terriglobia bacterium]
MTEAILRLLCLAQDGYNRGSKRTSQPTRSLDAAVENRIMTVLESRLPQAALSLVGQCRRAQERGLEAARQQQTLEACRCFGLARVLCDSPALSLEGRLLCQGFQEAAEAYLDYRLGDFEGARSRLHRALTSDSILEEEFGHKLLHVYRLQFTNHLIRLEVQLKGLAEAMDLADRMLSYLEGRSESLPLPGCWSSRYVALLPRELIAAMIVRTSSEVARALAGLETEAARGALEILWHHIDLESAAERWEPQARTWFQAKRAFISGDSNMFLRSCASLLAEGPSIAPILWHMTALDLAAFCEPIALPEAQSLRRKILRKNDE